MIKFPNQCYGNYLEIDLDLLKYFFFLDMCRDFNPGETNWTGRRVGSIERILKLNVNTAQWEEINNQTIRESIFMSFKIFLFRIRKFI